MTSETHILFVCKYNRFRSVMAEALFNKLNKLPHVKAKSAGAIRGSPLDATIIAVAREHGLKIKKSTSSLTYSLMKWQTLTVVVADDVPASLFKKNKKQGKNVLAWNIPDTWKLSKGKRDDLSTMRKIVRRIELRVRDLLEDLEKEPLKN